MQSNIVTINVGGKVYQVAKDILLQSQYFTSYLERWNNTSETIFISRSSKVFDHVFAALIDSSYPFPEKYVNELEYYGINKQINAIPDKHKVLIEQISELKKDLLGANDKIDNLTEKIENLESELDKAFERLDAHKSYLNKMNDRCFNIAENLTVKNGCKYIRDNGFICGKILGEESENACEEHLCINCKVNVINFRFVANYDYNKYCVDCLCPGCERHVYQEGENVCYYCNY